MSNRFFNPCDWRGATYFSKAFELFRLKYSDERNTSYLDPRPAGYFDDIKSVEGDKIIILLTLFLPFHTRRVRVRDRVYGIIFSWLGLGLGLGFGLLLLNMFTSSTYRVIKESLKGHI